MLIHTIHVASNVVRIGYIENEETIPRAYTLKSKELARPELYSAMKNIFKTLADDGKCFAAGCDGTVNNLAIKYDRAHCVVQYALKGIINAEDGPAVKFQTEKIDIDYRRELNDAVNAAVKEAALYIKGKRAQMTLDETP